jgi:hypothetical protein
MINYLNAKVGSMRAVLLSVLVIITLFSADIAWAATEITTQPCLSPSPQAAGTAGPTSTLTVDVVCTPYSYRSDDGTTIVLGEVQNNNFFPITNVKVGVQFLDSNGNSIEYKVGTTLLQVVPAGGKAPFSISSTKPDPSITRVSVNLAGFVSASTRDQVLNIAPGMLQVSDKLLLSGNITNNGNETSVNNRLYLLSYDPFQRVVAMGSTTIPTIGAGKTMNFSMTSISSSRAKTYAIVAESDHYQSKPTSITNLLVSLPVVISNTYVTDTNGTKFSTIPVGASVKITSDLKYLTVQSSQPYIYYVQVKQFGGQVEFIGNYTGVFLSGGETPSVTWIPHTAGSYYIETFVWSSDSVPLSSAGTRINVALVK